MKNAAPRDREPLRGPLHVEGADARATDLVRLLHEGAPAAAFARHLAELEALPDTWPGKPALLATARQALDVQERLQVQQQRERGLLAVIESANDLTGRLDLHDLLQAIVGRARRLLTADLAWLSVHDAGAGEFRVRVTEGALVEPTGRMATGQEHGVAGVVMATRLPFCTPDYLRDTRFPHDPALDEIFRAEGVAAVVGVPLIHDGDLLGLLFVADRYVRTHTAHDISILGTLATLAAVALRNARDFERAAAARAELEGQARRVQAAADAHARMTALLARGASLGALCAVVAELLDGEVLVLDEAAQPVARGTPGPASGAAAQPVAHRTPGTALGATDWSPHGDRSAALAQALRESRRSGRSVDAWRDAGITCRALPVIGGDDVLGTLLLFHRGVLDELQVRTFERSAGMVGIVLLSQERQAAARSRGATALLHAMLAPHDAPDPRWVDEAPLHGLDLAQPLALLLLDVEAPGAGYAARRWRARPPVPGLLVDEVEGRLALLGGAAALAEASSGIAAWAGREFAGGYRGVVSRPAAGAGALPAAHATARRLLGLLGRLGVQGRLVPQDELALYAALFDHHDPAAVTGFLESLLGPLLAHDRKRGTPLVATLLAWFEHQRNATASAQALGIHLNTMRQRLATIETLVGPCHGPRALDLHVALRLHALRT